MRSDLARRVARPIQYLDHEINAARKEPEGRLLFALAFPDTYELGMSHLGLKLLYAILNGRDDVRAERVFAPETDMAELLRRENLPLSTLESETPLVRCPLVGFSLQSELHYTNILDMLHLGGIPLLAGERGEEHPFVVGGGPLALNPEPLADFFDFILLGDGEEAVLEMVDAWLAWKESGAPRRAFLLRLASVPGIYVPSCYRVTYHADGTVGHIEPTEPGIPARVARRVIADLDRVPAPAALPVPFLETTHDRLTVEIARGCPGGCRFCHAGMTYRPFRQRSPETVLAIVEESLRRTGYDEVSLASLSTGDYCGLGPLVQTLARRLSPERISLSLPSIRPGTLPDAVVREVEAVRKSTFTIAPEAGTDRLRAVINKGITDEEIMETARLIFAGGGQSVKLYFMVGLPGETPADIDGILDIGGRIRAIAQQTGVKGAQVSVSVSSFVPKAHTPFQWAAMVSRDYLAATLDRLQKGCRRANLHFKWHDTGMSVIEGIMARGDRRLGAVIARVWERGGRSEAWTHGFDLPRWTAALAEHGLDPGFYLHRARGVDELFPWEHLDSRVSREWLLGEWRLALEGIASKRCQVGRCRACGACPEEMAEPGGPAAAPPAASPPAAEDRRFKVRIRFRKVGTLRFVSHLELQRAFYRACRRAGIPLSFTEGFNPHPRFSFAPPLAVGIAGESELVDLEIRSAYPLDALIHDLNAALPRGLEITAARFLPKGARALSDLVQLSSYRITLPARFAGRREELALRIDELLAHSSIVVERGGPGKKKRKDARPFIRRMALAVGGNGAEIDLQLLYTTAGSVKPAEILAALLPEDPEAVRDADIARTGLFALEDGEAVDLFAPPRIPRPFASAAD